MLNPSRRHRSLRADWADTMVVPYRSEAFAEDLQSPVDEAPRRSATPFSERANRLSGITLSVAALAMLSSLPLLLR